MRVQKQVRTEPAAERTTDRPAARGADARRFLPARRSLRGGDDAEGAASAPPMPPPTGGPLALHAPALAPTAAPGGGLPPIGALVDRMIVGATRDGLPEVRLDLGLGLLRGTEVRLLAGRHGLEATFIAGTEAARRVVEAQLADLARALEARGLHVARCDVTDRDAEGRRRERERGRGRPREDGGA